VYLGKGERGRGGGGGRGVVLHEMEKDPVPSSIQVTSSVKRTLRLFFAHQALAHYSHEEDLLRICEKG